MDIADGDEARREAMDRRNRDYQRQAAIARQKASEPPPPPVLGWDAQGEEIRRLNSKALGIVGSIIDGAAKVAVGSALAALDLDEEFRRALVDLAQFDNALTLLARCSTIARTWAARTDPPAGTSDPAKMTDAELAKAAGA